MVRRTSCPAAHGVHLAPGPEALQREGRVASEPKPDAIGHRHGRRVPAGQVRDPRRLALILRQALGTSGREVGRSVAVPAPAVIGLVFVRQLPSPVIAIVGHLVNQLVGSWMQLVQPVEAPFRLVEHVGDSVRTGLAKRVGGVAKTNGGELIRQEHPGGGVAARDQVLELVAGVVPATRNVDEGGVRHRAVEAPAVSLVADPVEVRVVSAALLPQETQQVLMRFPVGITADPEDRRTVGTHPQVVAARHGEA
jgi:hypothetical protein